uniref:Uncharacterized protein n=1 Tax=Meloidogyne incognita TaxID=6306 RepID=A0A914M1C4_MELIC
MELIKSFNLLHDFTCFNKFISRILLKFSNFQNTAEYQQYNTRTQICCDKPIERLGKTKCCYLKDAQGRFYPASYDSSSQCCTFPFLEITNKNENGTCT